MTWTGSWSRCSWNHCHCHSESACNRRTTLRAAVGSRSCRGQLELRLSQVTSTGAKATKGGTGYSSWAGHEVSG